MKKLLFLHFLVNIILVLNAQTTEDNYFTHPIHSRFYGYYLPLAFVNSFEETKDYLVSRKFVNEYEYTYIRIARYGIFVQEPIPVHQEGYSEKFIQTENDLKDYQFEIENNNEITVVTKNGEKYKKISNDVDDNIYAADAYLGRAALQDLVYSGNIILDNNVITIPSLDYEKFIINTWNVLDGFYEHLNINGFTLFLDGSFYRGLDIFMEIMNNEYTIFEKVTWKTGQVTKKIIWQKKL